MLTKKEVKEKNLKDGVDYLYLGDVRYRVGDHFYRGDREIGIKSIIDSHHFYSDDNCCWHTGMFNDFNCLHGKNMIPLEERYQDTRYAEMRLLGKQIFHTDILALRDGKTIEDCGECVIRYLRSTSHYVVEIGEERQYKDTSLHGVLAQAFGNQSYEVLFALQNWGQDGVEVDGILLEDKNSQVIKYDGFDHTVVYKGKTSGYSLLKRHCEPAQNFVLVKNLQQDGENYIGEMVCETVGFESADTDFYDYMKCTVKRALKRNEAEL